MDAIVAGDDEALRVLLRDHPELIRQRSSRDHSCTLLHYVSANGVEGYRQKTPPSIVEITRLLLASGADANATAHCYGTKDDTLGLTATSVHLHNASVMIPMLETLVAAGADVRHKEGPWTIIRFEVGRRFEDGETALHHAAYDGDPAVVELLLERGSPVENRERTYNGNALDWALWAWGVANRRRKDPTPYYKVIAMLVRAGETVKDAWYRSDGGRQVMDKVAADPRMQAALRGDAQ